MPQDSLTPGGVFLSYAREDTDAARRIADALHAFGIDVWFDQSELRGGDAWDAKIKKQIRECKLFVAIVSAGTQSRGEGYFRREWKLAVERTHDMAAGVPFLLPVVIDDTAESEALVPDELMRVQWTRMPHGVPSPQFVEQVRRLLQGSKMESGRTRPGMETLRSEVAAPPRKRIPGWTWGALTAVVVGVGAALSVSRKAEPTAPPVAPVAETKAPAAAVETPRSTDKSVAVIPFTNMSEEKDSAFFADGIHEDILTNLALVRQLRVVSRTSVMSYRGTTKPMKQIAQELGVTYILEGSVRRSGNKVRVTGQLIHAATDEHVWAQAYDRDLTDVFTIQAELSQQIAAALKAALSPEEKMLIARRPTENPAAYDLLLRARDVLNRGGTNMASRVKNIDLLQRAVELDPSFAQAWGELAASCAYGYFLSYTGMDAYKSRAKAAIERAVQLAPDDPEVYSSLGTYYYYAFRDYVRAAEQYEKRARLQPNSPVVFNSLALIQRRQGHWAESLVHARRASELDPSNLTYLRNLWSSLGAVRRWDEAIATQRRIAALQPGDLKEGFLLIYDYFRATGSTREGEAFFAAMKPEEFNSPEALSLRQTWAAAIGDFAEAVRLDKVQPYYDGDGQIRYEQAYYSALNYCAIGDIVGAKARLGDFPAELRAKLASEPNSIRLWTFLGGMEVILGHKEEGLRCSDRAVELLPESRDALDGVGYAAFRASNYDLAGEKDTALAEYARIFRKPSTMVMNVHELKHAYSTLHGDPRFEALLKDPANNAPLF